MDTTPPTSTERRMQSLLLWARGAGFRVTELELDGMKLKVDDLRAESQAEPKGKRPRDAHEAFAIDHGFPIPPDDTDDGNEDGMEDGA